MKNATKYLVVGSLGVLMTRRDISSLAVKGLMLYIHPLLKNDILINKYKTIRHYNRTQRVMHLSLRTFSFLVSLVYQLCDSKIAVY